MITRLERLGLGVLSFNAAVYAFSPLVCGGAAMVRGGSPLALTVFGVAAGAAVIALARHSAPFGAHSSLIPAPVAADRAPLAQPLPAVPSPMAQLRAPSGANPVVMPVLVPAGA